MTANQCTTLHNSRNRSMKHLFSRMVQNHMIDMIGQNCRMQFKYCKNDSTKLGMAELVPAQDKNARFKLLALVFRTWIRHWRDGTLAEKMENIQPAGTRRQFEHFVETNETIVLGVLGKALHCITCECSTCKSCKVRTQMGRGKLTMRSKNIIFLKNMFFFCN